ncbi:MAG: MFS transporter [Myxococcota bacterium]
MALDRHRRRATLGLIWCLYFVQGLPFGFLTKTVRALVYEHPEYGSRSAATLVTGLALPWLLKLLWAPLVDRYHRPRWGRRKSWLVPTQLLLSASLAGGAIAADRSLPALLLAVFVMNVFAATLDIAVDGLAVDCLAERDLGHGNAAQVVGYKLGMLAGGGFILYLTKFVSVSVSLSVAALLVAGVAVLTMRFEEPPSPTPHRAIRGVVAQLKSVVTLPGTAWLLLAVATYKTGEAIVDGLFTPLVLDAGFEKWQLGKWDSIYGQSSSILGSLGGGYVATRLPLLRALAATACARIVPLVGMLALGHGVDVSGDVSSIMVIAAMSAEHFFGGALTTVMFAFMMSQVDPRIGATHFTLLASVEVLGKTPTGLLSGVAADALGYTAPFAAAVILSVVYLLVLVPLRREASFTVIASAGKPPAASGRSEILAEEPDPDEMPSKDG